MSCMGMVHMQYLLVSRKRRSMNYISIRKFGLAFGMTGALLYSGCALLMRIVGHERTVTFFNTLLHGLDVSSIIRMDVSVAEVFIGLTQTFILSWLIGSCIAA